MVPLFVFALIFVVALLITWFVIFPNTYKIGDKIMKKWEKETDYKEKTKGETK